MIGQPAADFLHRNPAQAGVIKNCPRRFGAAQTSLRADFQVSAIGGTQLDLCVDAEQQTRQGEPPILAEEHHVRT